MFKELRAALVALLSYTAFYLAFFFQSLHNGNYIAPSDSLDFGVAAYLSRPQLWTEGMYSGYPIAADPQSLIWYPVLHLFRLAGLDWNIFLISAYIIASTAACLYIRRLTKSAMAGAFSGFAYGFSGVLLGHIGHFNQIHAAAWVPIGLYGLQLIREGSYRGGALTAAGGFAMMWLAGHPQVPVYTAYLSAALIAGQLLIDRPARDVALRRVAWSFGAMAIGFAIATISILPMVELGDVSRRSESKWDVYISKALPPWQLLAIALPFSFGGFWVNGSMPVPYFGIGGPQENTGYCGLLTLALALAAPFLLTTYRREARLWLGLTIVAVLLCLGSVTPVGTLFYYAPGYASFRVPARHLFVVALCLSIMAGLAFAELTRRREGWRRITVAVVVTLAIAAVALFTLETQKTDVRALLAGTSVYARWAIGWPVILSAIFVGITLIVGFIGRRPWLLAAGAALLVAMQVIDLTMLHYRMPGYQLRYADIVRDEAVLHPALVPMREELRRTGERALAADGSKNPFLLPNLTRPWDLRAAGGSGSLGIERYVDVLGMGGPGDVYPEVLSQAHHGVDLFSVRYALVGQASATTADMYQHPDRWTPLQHLEYYKNDPDTFYILFRNERARPRAWCVPAVARMTPGEALRAIRTGEMPGGGTFDPTRVALVEDDTLSQFTNSGEPDAQVVADVDRQQYAVDTKSPCVLVLSDVYYSWWRASVDGQPVDVAEVNHAMIGIPVGAGAHTVRLWLRPTSIWLGGGVSAIGLLCFVAIALGVRKDSKISRTTPTKVTTNTKGTMKNVEEGA